MLITPGALRALHTQFSGLFAQGYGSIEPYYPRLATVVPSSSKGNTYGWMAMLPGLREWLGERVVNNLAAHKFAIDNKSYELTVGVDRDDFEDDNLGQYTPVMQMIGYEARKFPDDAIVDLLKNGQSRLAFDGQNFFDTDHPVDENNSGGGTQQNYWSSGMALTETNLWTVRRTMAAYKGANSRAMRTRATHLIVPPALEPTARQILEAPMIVQSGVAVSNITQGLLDVIVVDELAGDDTTWYIADLSKPIKPLIWQQRKAPKLTALTKDEDDNVFWHRQYVWGVDARGAAGFGPWFLMAKMVA